MPGPILLFRPTLNIQFGSRYLVKKYKIVNGKENVNIASPLSMGEYVRALHFASAGYNGGAKGYPETDPVNYAINVWDRIGVYWIAEKVTYQ